MIIPALQPAAIPELGSAKAKIARVRHAGTSGQKCLLHCRQKWTRHAKVCPPAAKMAKGENVQKWNCAKVDKPSNQSSGGNICAT